MSDWPTSGPELIEAQHILARASPPPWDLQAGPLVAAGCFICFRGRGAWAAGARTHARKLLEAAVVAGTADAPYEPGLLALREGPPLERAVRALEGPADLLLVNATGLDHPRRAGLALHLGAVLAMPSVGVTDRPLVAFGSPPEESRGSISPLSIDGAVVGYWVRTRSGARPVAVSGGWRTTPEVAAEAVLRCIHRARTPQALRRAREAARLARAGPTNAG